MPTAFFDIALPTANKVSDHWLTQMITADEIAARSELVSASKIPPDSWKRRARIKRHQHQAYFYMQKANTYRELLTIRKLLAAKGITAAPVEVS